MDFEVMCMYVCALSSFALQVCRLFVAAVVQAVQINAFLPLAERIVILRSIIGTMYCRAVVDFVKEHLFFS